MRPIQFNPETLCKCFARKKILSKAELLRECGCSSMTAWRLLSKVGYFTSYNHNANYYTLATIPQFNDHGLWCYRDVRFSKWGNLSETVIAGIERSPGGMTAQEIADFLGIPNLKPLLTRLTVGQRLRRETMRGVFVYLAIEPVQHEQQLERRQIDHTLQVPPLDPQQIIALLVEMIQHPEQTIRQWARRLARRNIPLGTQGIKAAMEHYHLLEKKSL
jgi:hypothetical protein